MNCLLGHFFDCIYFILPNEPAHGQAGSPEVLLHLPVALGNLWLAPGYPFNELAQAEDK